MIIVLYGSVSQLATGVSCRQHSGKRYFTAESIHDERQSYLEPRPDWEALTLLDALQWRDPPFSSQIVSSSAMSSSTKRCSWIGRVRFRVRVTFMVRVKLGVILVWLVNGSSLVALCVAIWWRIIVNWDQTVGRVVAPCRGPTFGPGNKSVSMSESWTSI